MVVAHKRLQHQQKQQKRLPSARSRPRPARPGARRQASVSSFPVVPVLGLAVAVLSGVILVSRYGAVTRTGYQVAELQADLTSLRAENERLKMEVDRLLSLDRVERIATTRLGMIRPEEVRLVAALPAPGVAVARATEAAPEGGLRKVLDRLMARLAGRIPRAEAGPAN